MLRAMTTTSRKGFSLLEVTIALGISGTLLTALWQLTSVSSRQREIMGLSSQATAVTAAAQNYVNGQRSALLAMPGLAALNSVVRVKITSTDTGDTTDSVQSAGYLAPGFRNSNSYGQSYALFVRREDDGSPGVADFGDRLVALLVTTGGSPINDVMGAKIAGQLGAPGGFIYADDNPSLPATANSARGAAGGWTANFTTAWSGASSVSQAGRLAILVNLLPSAGGGGITGATELDDLTDGKTDYVSLYNVFAGQGAGNLANAPFNTAMGYNSMYYFKNNMVKAGNNTAFGTQAFVGRAVGTSGVDNTTVGYLAADNITTASRNTTIGANANSSSGTYHDRVLIGSLAGSGCFGNDLTAVGKNAARCSSSITDATGTTAIGASIGHYRAGIENALLGARIGYWSPHTGSYNAALGFENIYRATASATYNVAIGYRAGYNLSSGTNNILIGNTVNAPGADDTYRLNIGGQIFGNMSTKQVNFGSATLVAGISLDVGSKTDAIRLPVGNTAQRPVCDVNLLGAIRFNTQTDIMEFCTVRGWQTPVKPSPTAVTPVAPPTTGYFVFGSTQHDANFGGMEAAHAYCLNDLLASDWLGKADANARGLLVPHKVRAFLTSSAGAGNLMPVTTYYFARAGSPTSGGASFTTDTSGQGFGWPNAINGATYFDTNATFWLGSRNYSTNYFGLGGCCTDYCGNWTSNTSGDSIGLGTPNQSGHMRYSNNGALCSSLQYLVCIVNP